MKDYTITFGQGSEAITFFERNCVSFSEAVIRLEFTGLHFTELTSVKEAPSEC